MTIVKCKACETEFELNLLKYENICPYAYCYSRGQKAEFEIIKSKRKDITS